METVFLACFVFGLLFTLASVILGAGGGLHIGHATVGHAAAHGHVGHVGQPHVHLGANTATGERASIGTPFLNASSALGALTWFGAAGYVLLRIVGPSAVAGALIGGLLAGALGWYLVARFLGLVLKGEVEMNPEDYRLEGTVGKLTVGIPAGGTGEIVFDKAGVRRSESARTADGLAIPRGTEVVITSYADGFACVQPWGEFLATRDALERERRAASESREA